MAGPEKNPGGGAADVAPVAAPCRNITGRFAEDCGFCCTDVHLEAEGTNINDGTNVEFEIVNQTNGEHVTSANGRMNGGKVRDVQWSCRKTDGYKQGDTYTLQITAGQCQVKGENEFSIIELQDIPPKIIHHGVGGHEYIIEFAKFNNIPSIIITKELNFRFVQHREIDLAHNIDNINNYDADEHQNLNNINGKFVDRPSEPGVINQIIETVQNGLSNKFFIRLRKCTANGIARMCDIPIIIILQQDPNATTINLWETITRADSSNWGQNHMEHYSKWSWYHEAGHTIGWYDEYDTHGMHHRLIGNAFNQFPNLNNVNSNDTAEGIWYREEQSLMGVIYNIILRNDFYQQYRRWFEDHCNRLNETWDVIPENSYID